MLHLSMHLDDSTKIEISPIHHTHPTIKIDELQMFFGKTPQDQLDQLGHLAGYLDILRRGVASKMDKSVSSILPSGIRVGDTIRRLNDLATWRVIHITTQWIYAYDVNDPGDVVEFDHDRPYVINPDDSQKTPRVAEL